MERRCDTCEWWDIWDADVGEADPAFGKGYCKRSPPVALSRWHWREGVVEDPLEGAWPFTDVDDWCGEWKKKEAADGG